MILSLLNKKTINLSLTTKSLTILIRLKQIKRFYPNNSQQIILEAQRLLLNKIVLHNFCNHFKTKSLTELLTDTTFIHYVHTCIHQKPTLHSRAFQVALEMTYSKRKFNLEQLEQYYKDDFNIEDTFQVNKNLCDQSTIFTSVITKDLINYLNLDKKDVIVHATPLFLSKEQITPFKQKIMDYNKEMTGNTCPDVSIKERPYDYKDSKDVSYNKNHLYFIDQENLIKECTQHIHSLKSSLWSNIKTSRMENEVLKYSKNILKIIDNGHNTKESAAHVYEKILLFVKKSPPPLEFKMPLFIYKTKANLLELNNTITSEQAAAVPLETGKLNDVKVRKAIGGLIDAWPDHLKIIVQKATSNTLTFASINENTIDQL